MQLVHVTLRVKPGMTDLYEKTFFEVREKTLEEPGCSYFELSKDANDPNTYHVFETYAGPEAVAFHTAQDYYNAGAKIFVECIEGDHMEEINRRGLTGREMYSVVKGVTFSRYDLIEA